MGTYSSKLLVMLCCFLPFSVLEGQAPQFQFRSATGAETYELLDGTGAFETTFLVTQTSGSPVQAQGLSIGGTHDSALLQVTSVAASGPISLLNGGAGPDFFAANIYLDGFTVVTVFSFDSSLTIEFATEQPVVKTSYSMIPSSLVGNLNGATTTISFSDTVGLPGAPVVQNIITVSGQSYLPEFVPGVITLTPVISVGDCDGNLILDSVEMDLDPLLDCNLNEVLDDCDLASGTGVDCNGNGVIDSCDISSGFADCDANSILDLCDLASGLVEDCNQNLVPDSCELSSGIAVDCNANGTLDVCDLTNGLETDCDGNGTLDVCDLASGLVTDCDGNGLLDSCELALGLVGDCNQNLVPDSCELSSGIAVDCNANGTLDFCDLASGLDADCDGNGILDSCDLLQGNDTDMNNDGIPDSCECHFPNQLTCERIPGELLIELTWGDSSSPVQVFRDNTLIASLIDGQTSYIDGDIPCSCSVDYMIQKECDNVQIATETCTFDWVEAHPDFAFSYSADPVNPNFTLVQGGAPTVAEVDLFIEGSVAQGSPCGPAATHGFSMGMSHDPARLSVVAVELAGEMLSVSPDYVSFAIGNDMAANSNGDVGWCMGVLYSLDPVGGGVPGGPALETVSYEIRKLVASVTYEAACGDWENSGVTDLQFEDRSLTDNSPPIGNVVGVCGVVYTPDLSTPSAQIEIIKGPAQPLFIRGDCSNQGSINIQDAVLMLNYLFSGTEIPCEDACDADDDGLLNLVDPLFDLMFIMGLGPMPPAPAVVCGADPTPDSISCDLSVSNNCEDPCPFEDCGNGLDDDLDGLIDCNDSDCLGSDICP